MTETLYRHKKRGTVYRIIHESYFQGSTLTCSAAGELDDRPVVVYQDVEYPQKVWVRLRKEFFDGRFEVLK